MDLTSLYAMLPSKLSSMDLENTLSIILIVYTILFLIKEFTSQQKRWDNEPVLRKFTEFTMFSHHPEVSGLKEWFEDLVRVSVG